MLFKSLGSVHFFIFFLKKLIIYSGGMVKLLKNIDKIFLF